MSIKIENNFPKNLKKIRKENNMTQIDLAKLLNKDYSTIAKWESGTRSPNMQDTLEVCKVFEISLDKLVLTNLTDERK